MHEVKDGSRTLQFSGKLLAESSSWRPGTYRWIEFKLYKTDNGSYIISRIGDALPCEECRPTRSVAIIFPEKHRHWAQVSEEPTPVLDALYKYDQGGARYLTNVAQRLLEDASDMDRGIESVYRIELIP